MGAKYSYKWCEYFADPASTILKTKVCTFFGVSKMSQETLTLGAQKPSYVFVSSAAFFRHSRGRGGLLIQSSGYICLYRNIWTY